MSREVSQVSGVEDLRPPVKPAETRVFKVFDQSNRALQRLPPAAAPCASEQARCISLQNFAHCETPALLRSPTARLGCRIICTTSRFAQKEDAKPVGGRGISDFRLVFFCPSYFSVRSKRLDDERVLAYSGHTPMTHTQRKGSNDFHRNADLHGRSARPVG